MNRNEPAASPAGATADSVRGAGGDADSASLVRESAVRYGMEFLEAIPDAMLDPLLVAGFPVEWARSNCLLPVRAGAEVGVVMADPDQVGRLEEMALVLGMDLRPILASRDAILRAIEHCYYSRRDSPQDFLKDLAVGGRGGRAGAPKSDDLLQVAEKAPVTQLANLILLDAVKRGASDIHFEPFESRLRVRYRIDGVLYEQASPPKDVEEALISRLKVMAHMDIAEKRLPQDGMARVRVGEREIDVRVSTIPVAEGERVVLRLLDRDSALLPLNVLGMSDGTLRSFRSLLTHPNGMIVVSGPTGSGKTTTLYAALRELDSAHRNILTIEDPIEYQLADIGQMQVKPKIGLSFAQGLRHVLRQDPDVILVGEARDIETAEIAIRASLTGHLVLTTLHTNDAPGAVVRLVDMGVEPYLLSSCLRGVLAQRLVRKLCLRCRQPSEAGAEDAAGLGERGAPVAGKRVWTARGCEGCLDGYRGRTGLFELMVVDGAMQDVIRAGKLKLEDVRRHSEQRGMVSLREDGIQKALDGVTSVGEVANATSS